MKNGYFEFDMMMFPRKLWVYVGKEVGVLQEVFDGLDEPDKEYDGFVCGEAVRKLDNKIGVVAVFPSRKEMTVATMAHEASHVVDSVEDAIGAEHGGEYSAYLAGWVCLCMDYVKRGKCDKFIEIEKR